VESSTAPHQRGDLHRSISKSPQTPTTAMEAATRALKLDSIPLSMIVPAGILALWLFFALIRSTARARAQRHATVRVITWANHKGGVGKTTTAFFVAKQLAVDNKDKNILVVDCSIYGDLTRLLLGSASNGDGAEGNLVNAGQTVEHFAASVTSKRSSWLPSLRGTARVERHIARVKDSAADAPANLFLMTNRAQWLNGPHAPSTSGGEEHGMEDATDEYVAAVSQALRASLAAKDKPWIVIVDTDGGLLHGMSKFALCASDHIVVPTNADTADMRRLHVMLRYVRSLHQRGMTTGTVGIVFFNNLKVKNNSPSDDLATLGLDFTVADDVADQMRRLADFLRDMRGEFPALLKEVEPETFTGRSNFFAGIRHGGVTMQRVKDRPYDATLSDQVAEDFAKLARRVNHLAAGTKLAY